MITTDTIKSGICTALSEAFPDNEIYTENVEQGLDSSCFSVVVVESSIKPYTKWRYLKSVTFCVHFFPSTDEPLSEIDAIQDELQGVLEYITVDESLIMGRNMNATITDGVLAFLVTYSAFVKKPREYVFMEEHRVDFKEKK